MRYLKILPPLPEAKRKRKCRGEVVLDEDRGGIVCCGRLWPFPGACCELCDCSWGAGSVFSRVESKR